MSKLENIVYILKHQICCVYNTLSLKNLCSKAIRSSRAFLCCLATPDDKNGLFLKKKSRFLNAYLAQMKWYISVYMPIHYLSKIFDSENKSFIEFIPLGYQTGVLQRLGLF